MSKGMTIVNFLEPEWIGPLLQQWATSDTPRLGLPRVAPMWAAARDAGSEDGDDSEELVAVRQSLDRLAKECPAEHAAVLLAFRPWVKPIAGKEAEPGALERGAQRLADWVDELCGD